MPVCIYTYVLYIASLNPSIVKYLFIKAEKSTACHTSCSKKTSQIF